MPCPSRWSCRLLPAAKQDAATEAESSSRAGSSDSDSSSADDALAGRFTGPWLLNCVADWFQTAVCSDDAASSGELA